VAELTGGELCARVLREAGVGHVFTLCGGHILSIYDGCLTEGARIIDVLYEQAAAHCADAYARLTRNVGVAVVTAGPGVTDAVTGIANAHAARSPVLLIGGLPRSAFAGSVRSRRWSRSRCCGPSPRARGRWRRRGRSPRC
jgi:acetolactate synthase-1/2/3 large subunit